MTTGGFTSAQLAQEAEILALPSLEMIDAFEIGEIAVGFALARKQPVAIEVRLGDWTVFHVSLPGSKPDNDNWIAKKARVVARTGHSTMFERVLAEEQGIDWHAVNGLSADEYAIHGGGLPLRLATGEVKGTLLISGLPQVEDHLLGVEVLTEFLARKGEDL